MEPDDGKLSDFPAIDKKLKIEAFVEKWYRREMALKAWMRNHKVHMIVALIGYFVWKFLELFFDPLFSFFKSVLP